MRIGLNLLPVQAGIGGSLTYIQRVLHALGTHDHENEYVAFATETSAWLVPQRTNFRTVLLPIPARSRVLRVLYENSVFRFAIARQNLDCLHHLFGTLPITGFQPTVVTMYDLIEFERPADFGFVKRTYLRAVRPRAAANATMIAPMSHATEQHLHERLGVPLERMEVVPPPLEHDYVRQPAEAVARFRVQYGLPANFWLVIADQLPRKNYDRLLAALAILRIQRPGSWPLVIRGEETADFRQLVDRHRQLDFVTFLGRLTDEEMPLLYSSASALVFPSMFEGGGLPVLEALACGCPIVASNIATTLEFAGPAALTFDPSSISEIAAAMHDCEVDERQRANRVETGLAIASHLRPVAVAQTCLRAYSRAVAAGTPHG